MTSDPQSDSDIKVMSGMTSAVQLGDGTTTDELNQVHELLRPLVRFLLAKEDLERWMPISINFRHQLHVGTQNEEGGYDWLPVDFAEEKPEPIEAWLRRMSETFQVGDLDSELCEEEIKVREKFATAAKEIETLRALWLKLVELLHGCVNFPPAMETWDATAGGLLEYVKDIVDRVDYLEQVKSDD